MPCLKSAQAVMTKYQRLEGLNNRNFIFSQFWSLEMQAQYGWFLVRDLFMA